MQPKSVYVTSELNNSCLSSFGMPNLELVSSWVISQPSLSNQETLCTEPVPPSYRYSFESWEDGKCNWGWRQMMLHAGKSEIEDRKLFLQLVIFFLIDLPQRGFFAIWFCWVQSLCIYLNGAQWISVSFHGSPEPAQQVCTRGQSGGLQELLCALVHLKFF